MDNSKIWITPANAVSRVRLRGARGYINGPSELHQICRELYSSTALGTTASNMTIENFETALSASGDVATKLATAKANYTNTFVTPNVGINGTGEYTQKRNQYFIEIGENGITGGTLGESILGTSLNYYKASSTNKVTATQTYYDYTQNTVPSPVWNVFSGTRWLASSCVDVYSGFASFAVRRVERSTMAAEPISGSDADHNNSGQVSICGVCPLVSLPSSLQLDANGKTSHTTQANTWKIIH